MDKKTKKYDDRIVHCLAQAEVPLSADGLCDRLRIKKGERPTFLVSLKRLEEEGRITHGKKGRYSVNRTSQGERGRVLSLSKGFAFARLERDGRDCFIPGRYMGESLPGDIVLLRTGDQDERGPTGEVVRILEKGERLYSGRLAEDTRGRPVVEPDGMIRYALPVRKSTLGGAAFGDKVRFSAAYKDGDVTAGIVTVYGQADSAKVCADAIVDSMGIPSVFPDEVIAQAERLQKAGVTPEEIAGREDLRDRLILTIDGRDAKDLDDAISLYREGDGWVLGVHIADVSQYVRRGTPLDEEALLRGTSVYFADRVIPMLPPALSNHLCSLNPGEDKLALSALMTFDDAGIMQGFRLSKSVICSAVRGVYSEVNELFQDTAGPEVRTKYAAVLDILMDMRRLAARLRELAEERGGVDLISQETQFLLDEKGEPAAIRPRVTGEAEEMIEQFMIAANVAVARLAREKKLPFVYRVHDAPDSERLAALFDTARLLGFRCVLHPETPPHTLLRALMDEARQTPYARLISEQILRCMAKAQYSDNPLGHYGLSLEDYCHFTSPIRRYPDLAIHRILTDYLQHAPKAALYDLYGDFVREAADRSSACEVRAMTAERSCEACYKAAYMAGFLGQSFPGIIASVTEFGVYVELENTAEGLVRLESLSGDGLRFDGTASLVDPQGRRRYMVGDSLAVTVAACDVSAGRITFLPVQPSTEDVQYGPAGQAD